MILFRYGDRLATSSSHTAFRRVVEMRFRLSFGFSFLVIQQVRLNSGEWVSRHNERGFSITRWSHWGLSHIMYDGPHCSFSVGFLHFLWNGDWGTGLCQKCMADWES